MNSKRKIITFFITLIAKLVVKKYKPTIVAITGNVGKSSTKEAIAIILQKKFRIRKNELNYNTPIGVALTIIGVDQSGSNSIYIWISHFLSGLKLLFKRDKNYPNILVLEYSADRPNDIMHLCKVARPDIAVLTNIGSIPVHIEYFTDVDKVYEEKSTIIKMLKKHGTAILNFDNPKIFDFKKYTKANILSYGFTDGADLRISSFKIEQEEDIFDTKMYMRFEYKNHFAPFETKTALGIGYAYAFLCGIAVGLSLDMNLVDCLSALEDYRLLKGRLNLIEGIKSSYIINDCYNASPISVENALLLMKELKAQRKVFVLGDMLELGQFSEKAHRLVAKQIIDAGISKVITIGDKTKFTDESLTRSFFEKNNISHFTLSKDARLKVQDLIYPGDLILIKGSHGMKLDIIVKEIAFNPLEI